MPGFDAEGADPQPGEVTQLLRLIESGDPSASDRLMELVYDEVRKLARGYLRGERPGHSLQATELAHEAYLKLLGGEKPRLADRHHFFVMFARSIRRVLVDHARERRANKRGGDWQRTTLSGVADLKSPSGGTEVDVLSLNEALDRLGALSERQARIVELRYFLGYSAPEVAEILGVGVSTVNREWALARAWLQVQLEA